MMSPVLIVPGIGNSGPSHWQSLWQARRPEWHRLQVKDWDHVVCDDWVSAIGRHVASLGPDTVIVAHSLGCLAVIHWAAREGKKIRGAMLVAVPDPASAVFPAASAIGFSPVPLKKLAFPSTVVASTDDPYGSAPYARVCSKAWGANYVEAGPCGHLNSQSGLGDWPFGLELLEQFSAGS
jgi:uncharacterized protein